MEKKVNFSPYLFSLLKLCFFVSELRQVQVRGEIENWGKIDVISVTFPNSPLLPRGVVDSHVFFLCFLRLECHSKSPLAHPLSTQRATLHL